jgi:cytochrome c peroxidase
VKSGHLEVDDRLEEKMKSQRRRILTLLLGLLSVGAIRLLVEEQHTPLRSALALAEDGVFSGDGDDDDNDDGGADDACKTHKALLKAALAKSLHDDADDDDDGDAAAAAIHRGRKNFDDRKLHGLGANRRACADCHMANDNFQLSPASAKARFDALMACRATKPDADDPLFRPIDADDFRTNGAAASDFRNVTENGLIRITFPLPSTLKLVDDATGQVTSETHVDVWRSVPSVFNVKLTGPDPAPLPGTEWPRGPNVNGGYQLDARVTTLQEQALGALINHAQIQRAPRQSFLDDVAAFQNQLFSSDSIRAASAAIDQGEPPPDPDPPLDELETQGKAVFDRACAQCHGSVGQSNPAAVGKVRYVPIRTQCPRPVDGPNLPGWQGTPRFVFKACAPSLLRNVRTYEITRSNGQIARQRTSDPGRTLLTGFAALAVGPPPLAGAGRDDWLALDTPTVRNISKTAPYFHNNSADTLEEVLDHYDAFFKLVIVNLQPGPRPPVISTDGVAIDRPFTAAERSALLAYMRKL